ncbi:hypothetical protein VTN77DRAFT_998 [Rasamsonia byssochlamydoides]|uniref:uncharacterized protein n=1 Tax=Rasamsonia byssochlamydoides TaxID=89139 RepID=UPI0037428777
MHSGSIIPACRSRPTARISGVAFRELPVIHIGHVHSLHSSVFVIMLLAQSQCILALLPIAHLARQGCRRLIDTTCTPYGVSYRQWTPLNRQVGKQLINRRKNASYSTVLPYRKTGVPNKLAFYCVGDLAMLADALGAQDPRAAAPSPSGNPKCASIDLLNSYYEVK